MLLITQGFTIGLAMAFPLGAIAGLIFVFMTGAFRGPQG